MRCEYIPCSCFDEASFPTRRLGDFPHFFQSDHLNETPSTVSFTEVLFLSSCCFYSVAPPKAPADAHTHTHISKQRRPIKQKHLSSFDVRGAAAGQLSLDGADLLALGLQRAALLLRRAGRALVGRAGPPPLRAVALVGQDEGLPALRSDELNAQLGRRPTRTPRTHRRRPRQNLRLRLAHAVGEGGDAALLEVLVHEGVDDGVVEAVEEADGLDDGDDHVQRDVVVLLLQVV